MFILNFWVSMLANIVTIATGALAIYLFLISKDRVRSAIDILLNYSTQLTLTDLKLKIERLNDYSVNDDEGREEVLSILSEIQGQMNGNKAMRANFSEQLSKIELLTSSPKKITEPKKRSIVSELREVVRNFDISNTKESIQ